MKLRLLFLVACTALVVGCSSKIATVKNSPSLTSNYTVGQVLDNNSSCINTNWATITDTNGRELVEYTCNFKLDPSSQQLRFKQAADSLAVRVRTTMDNYTWTRTSLEKIVTGVGRDDRVLEDLTERVAGMNRFLESSKEKNYDWGGGPPEYRIEKERQYRADLARETANLKDMQESNKAYQVSNEPLYKQVVAFEDTFKATVQNMEAKDLKWIEDARSKTYKLEQKIQFLVSDQNVKRIAYGFYIDGKQVSLREDMNYIASLLESPTGNVSMSGYWAANLPMVEFNMERFPFTCDPKTGCVEGNK